MTFGVGGLTRIFCYDLVLKQWAVVDLPFAISCVKQIRSPGTIPITVAGGASDATLRRFFAGDLLWDDGSQVQWSFRAAELFQEGGSAKMFYRRLVLRGTNALNSSLVVNVSLQGERPGDVARIGPHRPRRTSERTTVGDASRYHAGYPKMRTRGSLDPAPSKDPDRVDGLAYPIQETQRDAGHHPALKSPSCARELGLELTQSPPQEEEWPL